uniref:alpha-L-rhamnosidase N-terminal domain-containing protein n=1 Tax=Streptomyces scabiei TaxID=1930 RepID=UPI0018FEF46B
LYTTAHGVYEAELNGSPVGDHVLAPWQDKYPGVDGTDEAVVGRPGAHPADASLDACPVAVGRRIRPARGAPHIGPVTYAAPRRSVAPVAVVPVAVVPHT